jgi:hypothetical protein
MRFFTAPLALLLLGLSLSACQSSASASDEQQEEAFFFNLKKFFEAEISRLENGKIEGVKKVQFNQEKDETKAQHLNYAKELEVFVNSDINKLSWRDKYSGDTSSVNGQIQKIVYKALDEHLKTREVVIQFEDANVSDIRIKNRLKSIIADARQNLRYRPQVGYEIKGQQNMSAAGDATVGVEVVFVNGG